MRKIFHNGQQLKYILFLFLTFLWSISAMAIHENEVDDFGSPQLQELAQKLLLNEQFYPDFEKIFQMREKVLRRRNEIAKIVYHNALSSGLTEPVAQDKANSDELIFASQIMLNDLDTLTKVLSQTKTIELCRRILQLDEAFDDNDEHADLIQILGGIKVIFFEHHLIQRDIDGSLKDDLPTNLGFTQDELVKLAKNGLDISKIDPANSTFWQKPRKIATILPFRDLSYNFQFLEGSEFSFEQVTLSGHNPKIKVNRVEKIHGQTVKHWRLKFDDEVNVEVASSRIMRLVGYPADLFYYVKRPKIYFSSEAQFFNFKKDWLSRYGREKRLNRLISEIGEDSHGKFVIFHEASARPSLPSEKRIGPFHWDSLGHHQRRDVRGHLLLQAFLSNANIKNAHNNKVKLVANPQGEIETADGPWSLLTYISDVGSGFGSSIFKNNPNNYSHILIDQKYRAPSSPVIKLNYKRYHIVGRPNPFLQTHYSDMKWMARYIAQITRAQLTAILREAHWPEPIQQLLLEKMSHRRNDIVWAFDLEKEGFTLWSTVVPWPTQNLGGFNLGDSVVDGELIKNFQQGENVYPTNYLKKLSNFYEDVKLSHLDLEENFAHLKPEPVETLIKKKYHSGIFLRTKKVSGIYRRETTGGQKVFFVSVISHFSKTSPADVRKVIELANHYLDIGQNAGQENPIEFTPEIYNGQRYGEIFLKIGVSIKEQSLQKLLQQYGGDFKKMAKEIISSHEERESNQLQRIREKIGAENINVEVKVEGEFLPVNIYRSMNNFN